MDGAVYERYKGDGALYTAASGPKLTIRIAPANHFHFARTRMAVEVEDKQASAAAKGACSTERRRSAPPGYSKQVRRVQAGVGMGVEVTQVAA